MRLTLEMQHKLAIMAAAGLHLGLRNEPKPKPTEIYLAEMQIRSESIRTGEGNVPEDEIQVDFCISTGKRDGHYSYMTKKTLQNYAEDAARGVPFVRDHTENLETQIGRTIAASYDEENDRVNATISMLRDTDDTPENMRVNEFIRRIERRYYDSASVMFRDATETCRICNKDIWDWSRDDPCPHIPGRTYNGVVCEYDVDNARLRHVGLVTSASNPEAKFLDTREWDENLRNIKEDGSVGDPATTDPKSLLERDGLKWRETLITDALKEGVRAEDGFDETVWKARLEKLDSEHILAQTEMWEKLGDARWGEGGRQTQSEPGAEEPTIWLPESLFTL